MSINERKSINNQENQPAMDENQNIFSYGKKRTLDVSGSGMNLFERLKYYHSQKIPLLSNTDIKKYLFESSNFPIPT